MNRSRTLILGTLVFAIALTANAQATRTWVSGVGDDVNPCSRTAPCKTFAGAISKTASGGEISVLDPAGFGAVTITKSITINGEGTLAGILSSGVTGILINGAGIQVTLIDLKINGGGNGIHGVRILNAGAVNIEDCFIYNFQTGGTSQGVRIENGAGTNVKVRIGNTRIFNIAVNGVASQPTGGGTVKLTLDHVSIFNTQSAVDVKNDTKADIRESSLTENAGAGVFAELSTAEVNVYNSTMSNNLFGVVAGNGGNPVIRLYGSQITDNTTDGIHINSGQVFTHGNNAIQGNAGSSATSGNISTQ